MSKTKSYSDKKIMTKAKFYEEHLCLNTWKMTPITEAWLDALAQDLYTWARDDDNALKLTQFYTTRGIANATMMKWIEVSPKLKAAHAAALQMIGDRRELGVIHRKYDSAMIAPMMYYYDNAWKQNAQWREDLKAKAKANAEAAVATQAVFQVVKTIEMPSFNEVPRIGESKEPPMSPEETARWARRGYPLKKIRKKDV